MKTINIFNENSMSDKDLVERISNGDQRAFTVIFDKYNEKLIKTLMSKNIMNREQAEDFVTEAFIDLYEKILNGKYAENGTMFNFLYTIAHRLFLKENKRNIEDVTENERLKTLVKEIFDDDNQREEYFRLVEEILKDLSIGKNEKELSCADILYAQYGIEKTSDENYYDEYPEKFTNILDVRRKRYKCLEKLKTALHQKI